MKINFRKLNLVSISLGAALLLVSFQNCNPSPNCEAGSGGEGCSATPVENQNSAVSAAARLPASSGSIASSGSSLNRGPNSSVLGGSGNAGGAVLGGGAYSSGNSGGASQGPILGGGQVGVGGNTTSTAFRFITQPKAEQVEWNGYFDLQTSVAGGTPPYTYQWHKNRNALTDAQSFYGLSCSTESSCRGVMNSYGREGDYSVVVKDSSNPPKTLTSPQVRLSVADPAGPCPAGNYAMYTGEATPGNNLPEMFRNIRGVFLISAANEEISFMASFPQSFPITVVYNMTAATFMQVVSFPTLCASQIPHINTASNNPGQYMGGDYGLMPCGNADGCGYRREGAVTMECKNARWRLVSNTCRWVSTGSGSGSGQSTSQPNDG